MFVVVTVLGLSLLFGTCTQGGETPTRTGDDRQWPASGAGDTLTQDAEEGSGTDANDLGEFDDDELPAEEDEDEEEEEEDIDSENSGDGLASPPVPASGRSRCVKLRDAKIRYENSYRPQCTDTGAFEPMQCHDFTRECWCVNANGDELAGTMFRHPNKPDCYSGNGGHLPVDGEVLPAHTTPVSDGGDFIIVDQPSTRPSHVGQKTPDPYIDDDDDQTPDVKPLPTKDWSVYVLDQPLILAGLIGGAVFVLLVLILVLMFIVYRMRKKDEGSYSLDEPRQSFGYTRAKDQEFFA